MARTAPTVSTSRALRTARPVRLAVVGATLSMAFALTSCSDSGGNNGDDAASPSASSATASNTEFIPASADGPAQNVPVPALPDAAREQTPEGAEATLEYWWDAMEYLYLTGDPEQLMAASEADCEVCEMMVETWESAYRNDEWSSLNGEIEIESTLSTVDEEVSQADIDYSLTHPELRHYSSNGDEITESRTSFDNQPWFAILNYDESNGQWLLYESVPSDLLSEEEEQGNEK
ncbi:DUF6318 family protein [Citricoccus muralis]|uniref:DUF6318 family protein n=1 Tax=Citricoccus muralis TaxID=169134 RepID=A0ABY8H6I5_9MICC|nr:DUF6318 family protein [Citricoccus muralis]WFP16262.1 DUF6318 family protein [Citricoccus muralis]